MHLFMGIFLICLFLVIIFNLFDKKFKFIKPFCFVVFSFFIFVGYDSYVASYSDLKFKTGYSLLSTYCTDIPKGSSIYLSYSSSYMFNNSFSLNENTSIETLGEFLRASDKNIYLYVRADNEFLLSVNLGLCNYEDSERVLRLYNNLVSDMKVNYNIYRCTILGVFYIDKEVFSDT